MCLPLLVQLGSRQLNETGSRLVLAFLVLVLTAILRNNASKPCMKLYRKTTHEKESRRFIVNTEGCKYLNFYLSHTSRGRCRGLNEKGSLIRIMLAPPPLPLLHLTLKGIAFKLLRATIGSRTCNILV